VSVLVNADLLGWLFEEIALDGFDGVGLGWVRSTDILFHMNDANIKISTLKTNWFRSVEHLPNMRLYVGQSLENRAR